MRNSKQWRARMQRCGIHRGPDDSQSCGRSQKACQRRRDLLADATMWKEFKEFAIKGNAFDLAVGVIIGAAFGSIVDSLVKDIIMPPISALTGGLDFSNKFVVLKAGKDGADSSRHRRDAVKAGAVTWNYGNFITLMINFLIVAFAFSFSCARSTT